VVPSRRTVAVDKARVEPHDPQLVRSISAATGNARGAA